MKEPWIIKLNNDNTPIYNNYVPEAQLSKLFSFPAPPPVLTSYCLFFWNLCRRAFQFLVKYSRYHLSQLVHWFSSQESDFSAYFMTMLHTIFENSGDILTTRFQNDMIIYNELVSKEFYTPALIPASLLS